MTQHGLDEMPMDGRAVSDRDPALGHESWLRQYSHSLSGQSVVAPQQASLPELPMERFVRMDDANEPVIWYARAMRAEGPTGVSEYPVRSSI